MRCDETSAVSYTNVANDHIVWQFFSFYSSSTHSSVWRSSKKSVIEFTSQPIQTGYFSYVHSLMSYAHVRCECLMFIQCCRCKTVYRQRQTTKYSKWHEKHVWEWCVFACSKHTDFMCHVNWQSPSPLRMHREREKVCGGKKGRKKYTKWINIVRE